MLPNAFINKTEQPTDDELAAVLGKSRSLWDQLLAELADKQDLVVQEWNSYSRKAGWSLRLKREKRNILYMIPFQGSYQVAFVLGAKAIECVRRGKFPQRVIKILDEAKRYAEGTGIRIDVEGPKDIAIIKKLAAIKLQN